MLTLTDIQSGFSMNLRLVSYVSFIIILNDTIRSVMDVVVHEHEPSEAADA